MLFGYCPESLHVAIEQPGVEVTWWRRFLADC
jgi:hypothetical protein